MLNDRLNKARWALARLREIPDCDDKGRHVAQAPCSCIPTSVLYPFCRLVACLEDEDVAMRQEGAKEEHISNLWKQLCELVHAPVIGVRYSS